MDDHRLAAELAAEAGALLLDLRSHAADEADTRSDALILGRLATERPDDAVLSEESADDLVRLGRDRVWIVDPLDGTREYNEDGRDDWAVHIALWERGSGVTAAAVGLPAQGRILHTGPGGAPAAGSTGAIPARPRLLVSRSRPPAFTAQLAAEMDADLVPMGSAGAKAMAVVLGVADVYAHAGGQWEWDNAAPSGVAAAAGLHVSRLDGEPLVYNQERPWLPDLLICRPELGPRVSEMAGRLLAAEAAAGPSAG
jgi:3'(2'), 5'-bisphosphate nucleotidase